MPAAISVRLACVVAVIAAGSLLTGCVDYGYQRDVAIQQTDDARCQSYGLKFGTPEYAQCRQSLEGQRQAAALAVLRAFRTNQSAGQVPIITRPAPAPSQASCVTAGVYTSCQMR
jgi:hypothetical protein